MVYIIAPMLWLFLKMYTFIYRGQTKTFDRAFFDTYFGKAFSGVELPYNLSSFFQRLCFDNYTFNPILSKKIPIIQSISISQNNKYLASCAHSPIISIWDRETNREIKKLEDENTKSFTSVCFSPDSETFAGASTDTRIWFWSCKTWRVIDHFQTHEPILCVSYSPDNKIIASGSSNSLWLWSLKYRMPIKRLEQLHVISISFSPFGNIVAWASSAANTVGLWSVETDDAAIEQAVEKSFMELSYWHDRHESEIKTLEGHSRGVLSVCFNPDGKTIATSGSDGTVRIWDLESGYEMKKLETKNLEMLNTYSGRVTSINYSPNGKTLALVFEPNEIGDDKVLVWEHETESIYPLLSTTFVSTVLFSHVGKKTLSIYKDFYDPEGFGETITTGGKQLITWINPIILSISTKKDLEFPQINPSVTFSFDNGIEKTGDMKSMWICNGFIEAIVSLYAGGDVPLIPLPPQIEPEIAQICIDFSTKYVTEFKNKFGTRIIFNHYDLAEFFFPNKKLDVKLLLKIFEAADFFQNKMLQFVAGRLLLNIWPDKLHKIVRAINESSYKKAFDRHPALARHSFYRELIEKTHKNI